MQQAVRLLGMVCVVFICGCQQHKQTTMVKQLGLTMTERELRENVEQLRAEIMGEFEALANTMIAETDDPRQRIVATRTKIRINEELIKATSHADPGVSLIDVWALMLQLMDYADQETVIEQWQEFHPLLVAAIDRTYASIIKLADQVTNKPDARQNAEELIATYVAENPLTGRLWRPSPSPLLTEYRRRTGGGVFGDVKSLDENVQSISDRLDIMTTQLPKQILWHADLLIQSRLDELAVDEIGTQLEQTVAALQDLPDEIERHRVETLADFDRQRQETLEAIDGEFDQTMDQFSVQRLETLAEIDLQRRATIMDIDQQRAATLDRLDGITAMALDEIDAQRVDTLDRFESTVEEIMISIDTQRDATVSHVEALTASVLEEADTMVLGVVNAIFLRALALVALTCLGGAVIVLVWRKAGR